MLYLLIGLSWLVVSLAVLILRLVREEEPERQWRLLLLAAAVPFLLFPLVRVCGLLLDRAADAVPFLDRLWPVAVLTVAGALVALVRGLRMHRRQRRLLAVCEPPVPALAATLAAHVERLGRLAGLRRLPRVLVYPRGVDVCALGIRRPVIVISRELLAALGEEELEAVLSHEIAHLRRGDYLLNWLGLLARWVFFYLPPWVLGWRVWADARERRADRLAASYTANPLALAAALITVWQSRPVRPMPAGAPALLDHTGHLEARIRRLIEPTPPSRPRWRGSASLALLLGGFLLLHTSVEGGTHLLARVSPEMATWEQCCDPRVSPFPHCEPPRRVFFPPPTITGSINTGHGAWIS